MSTSDDTQKDDVSEKRKQLSMLQDLLSRVYVSSDIQAVMQNIADSLEAILPNASISFLISSIEGREYMQQIFVTSTISVGITYQSIIMREINAYVSSLPDAISNKEALKLQLAKKIYFRFSHGLCEVDRGICPTATLIIPFSPQLPDIPTSKPLLGIFHLSHLTHDRLFSDKMEREVFNMIENAAEGLQQLQAGIDQGIKSIRNLSNSMHDGVLLYNDAMKVMIVNPALKEIFGFKQEDNVTLDEFLNKLQDMSQWLYHDLDLALTSGESYSHKTAKLNNKYYEISFTQLKISENKDKKKGGFFIFHDITQWREACNELQEKAKELDDLAAHDPLTGLNNRRELFVLLEQEKFSSERHHSLFALLFIDLDNFKGVNDTLGHDIGDEVLKEVASRLKLVTRVEDSLVRIGGDEFVVVLSQIKKKTDAGKVAEKILKILDKPYEVQDSIVNCSASIGIACFSEGLKNVESLLEKSDIALRRAKKLGKNLFEYYSEELNDIYLKRSAIESELQTAVSNNELSLYYQPVIDLKTNAIVGIEALLRWYNQKLGSVSPNEFIAIAEDIGIMNDIGIWVFENVTEQFQRWGESQLKDRNVFMAINISPYQLQSDEFMTFVSNFLKSKHMSLNDINFELTESAYMGQSGQLEESLTLFHQKGVHFSIDDFGTGYSSLSRLSRLPIATLKIDKSFIDLIGNSETDNSIVISIIALANSIGLRTIAEGVEIEEQLNFLIVNNCQCAQGYYFSKPLSVEDMNKYLEELPAENATRNN